MRRSSLPPHLLSLFALLAPLLTLGAAPGPSLEPAPVDVSERLLSPPRLHPCVGRWAGSASNGGSAPWSIDFRVTAVEGESCGTIEYPSLECGGVVMDCRIEDRTVHFLERYSHNKGLCAPAGRIEATCQEDTMVWSWFGMGSTSTELTRVHTSR